MLRLAYPASLLLVVAACGAEPTIGPATEPAVVPAEAPVDRGTPPEPGDPLALPADNPLWSFDAGGFVPSYQWYGEGSWDDVRMRAAGHLAAIGRDRARAVAASGDLAAAAASYRELDRALAAIPIAPESTHAARTVSLLQGAVQRDAALCAALADGAQPPPGDGGLAALRARVLGLALQPEGDGRAEAARRLQRELEPYLTPRDDLDLTAFADFEARHALRVRLLEAYLDSLDPLDIDERWGFWSASELQRQALALGLSAGALGGDDWSGRAEDWLSDGSPALDAPAIHWPSRFAAALRAPDQRPHFTVEGLGRLPTGDSLVDVAGWPGPAPIGSLAKLGLDDPAHRAWLEALAAELGQALEDRPSAIPAVVAEAAAELDAHGHGSRYYNIKQIRNDAVRQLALAGHPELALTVLDSNQPLHHQDWACPNRRGILGALRGRLAEAASGQAAFDPAWQETLAFLALVDRSHAVGPGGDLPGRLPPHWGGRPVEAHSSQ